MHLMRRIRLFLLLFLALMALLAGGAWFYHAQAPDQRQPAVSPLAGGGAQPAKIIVADDSSYAPFAFIDAENRPRGISIDLWKLWSQKTGVAVEFRLMEWDSALTAVREGHADVVGGLFPTRQREEFFDFASPYADIATRLFFHQQVHGVRGLEDLSGFTVGVVKGDSAEEWIREKYPHIALEPYPGAESLVKAALAGKIRVFVIDAYAARFYLAKLGSGDEFHEAVDPVAVNKLYAAVRKGNRPLLDLLQRGFHRISEREKHAIIEAWTGMPIFSSAPWIALGATFAAIAAALGLLLLWNLQLKRKVAEATRDVRQRNEDLQRSERNYREIFNATSDMIFLHDAVDGAILDMNQAAMELYPAMGLQGDAADCVSLGLPPFGGEDALSRIRKAATDGALVFEWRSQRRNGDAFWTEVALKSSRIGGENRVLAVVRDITERKRVEEHSARDDAFRQSIIDGAADGICACHETPDFPHVRFTVWNHRMAEITGYTLGEINISGWYQSLYPDLEVQARASARMDRMRQGENLDQEEWEITRKGGQRRQVLISTRMLPGGETGTNVLAVISDITERKRAEKKLRAYSEYQRALLDNFPFLVWLKDTESRFLAVNAPFARACGLDSPEALIGKTDLDVWPADLAAAYRADDREVLASGRPKNLEEMIERAGQPRCWFETYKSPVRVDDRIMGTVGYARDITARKRVEQRIDHLAYYDALTDLPNRALLAQRAELALAMAARHHMELAMLFLDLDRFKEVNDSLGHIEGDALLVQVAARLQTLIRAEDTACRLGGDEFVLLLPDTGQDGVLRVANKLLAIFHQPFAVAGHRVIVTVSIGIALYPHDGVNFSDLLKNADTALHRAKQDGRNTRAFYTREMNAATFERLMLEGELRLAIQTGQLRAYYQPKVRLTDGALVGAEALVRWQHPKRGLLAPEQFIPMAEASDLIVALGDWMLAEVCQQMAAWRAAALPPLTVAVNLAARHFRLPQLADRVHGLLEAYGLPPQSLELELTESTLVEAEVEAETLRALERLGVGLAIDDFGTGYSNLAYLKRLPLTTLKIDRGFVSGVAHDSDDRTLAATIVSLGHQMDLVVVAEGVETEEQRRILLGQGCDLTQGYLFSRPLPSDEFATTWLAWMAGP